MDRALQKYGINVGAETQRYGIDVGAQTQRYGIDQNTSTARAEIDARLTMQERELAHAVEQGQLSREEAARQFDVLRGQADREFNQNVITNFVVGLLSAKNSGLDPGKMSELLMGLGVRANPDGTLTVTAPNIEGLTTPAAPTPLPTYGGGGTQGQDGVYRDRFGVPIGQSS